MRRLAAAVLVLGLATVAAAEDRLDALRLRARAAEEFAYRLHDPGDVWTYWRSPQDGKPPLGHTMLLTRTEIARAYAGHGGLTKGEDYVYVMSVTGNSAGELLPDIVYHYRHHRGQWTKQSTYRDKAEYDARTFAYNQGAALRQVRAASLALGSAAA